MSEKSVTIVIPTFDGRLSKNDRLHRGRYGDSSIRQLKDSFITLIRAYGREFSGLDNLHVELIVYRPDKSWDAQNFGDIFWDMIAQALNVNDRSFASTKVIPEYDPIYPRFEIILRQEQVTNTGFKGVD